MKPEDVMERVGAEAEKMLADDVEMRSRAREITRAVATVIDDHCHRLAIATGLRVAIRERALGIIGIDDDPKKPHCLSLRNDIAVLAPGQEPPPGWTIYGGTR
jgi:hypothetical protein